MISLSPALSTEYRGEGDHAMEPHMLSQFRPAIVSLVLLTIITGVVYPLIVTGVARAFFPRKACGSLIVRDGKAVGSELIAQPFTEGKYFWPRPSAANYNAAGGSGSNLAPTNPALADAIRSRIATLQAADPTNRLPLPVDLVCASGSGLDPHVSVAAARYQLARITRARGMPVADLENLLARHIEPRTFGVLGEPRVNVLELNLALDAPPATAKNTPPAHVSGLTVYRDRGFLPAIR
jgi:potassium-transporting ATPase KdpC subunit